MLTGAGVVLLVIDACRYTQLGAGHHEGICVAYSKGGSGLREAVAVACMFVSVQVKGLAGKASKTACIPSLPSTPLPPSPAV